MEPDFIDTVLRMGAAVIVGIIVGTNRDLAGKPIGMRTLGLVSLGAAVVSLATIRLDLFAGHPDAMSRVVQGVIQGIMGASASSEPGSFCAITNPTPSRG
jgi:putative Mg2+ transporter-C (MgtC) family protein